MSKMLNSLVIQGIDTFDKIHALHDLLEIALDQEEFKTNGKQSRVILLIQTYLWSVESHFEELQTTLKAIKQQVNNNR